MKKFLALLLSLVMACALVACGDKKDDTNTDDQDNNEVTDFKVGFIIPPRRKLHLRPQLHQRAAKEPAKATGVRDTSSRPTFPKVSECYDKAAAELADSRLQHHLRRLLRPRGLHDPGR